MDMTIITDNDKDAITRLLTCSLPRTLSRHAIIVLHYFRSISNKEIPIDVLIGGCVLYSLKQRQCLVSSKYIKEFLTKSKESDIVGFELVLIQVIRHNVILIEACLRLVFYQLLSENPSINFDRERIIKVCLHLISYLYKTKWCLFPESSARGALLVACEKCDVELKKKSLAFQEPMVLSIADYLRKSLST